MKVDAYLLCSHCLAMGIDKPYLWRGEVLDIKNPKGIYHLHCPKAEPDIHIPACLVYPIDPGREAYSINSSIHHLLPPVWPQALNHLIIPDALPLHV